MREEKKRKGRRREEREVFWNLFCDRNRMNGGDIAGNIGSIPVIDCGAGGRCRYRLEGKKKEERKGKLIV